MSGRFPKPTLIETEIGIERQCNACQEWWPLDEEFFYKQHDGFYGFQSVCKACQRERNGYTGKSYAKVDDARVYALLRAGVSATDVASELGCSVNTVYKRLRILRGKAA